MKYLFSKVLHLFLEVFRNLKRHKVNQSVFSKVLSDLTPENDIDKDFVYTNALDWALHNGNVRNIALTGSYGSGKSSILKTYQCRRPSKRYLNISLATFQDKYNEKKDKDKLSDTDETIEKDILQHLFYKVKYRTIPFSRFRRITSIKISSIIIKTILMLLLIVCSIYLVFPSLLFSVIKNYTIVKLFIKEDIVIFVSVFFICVALIYFTVEIVKFCYKSLKVSRIKLEKAELEIDKRDNDQSVFNKYIDEIIYFFEVTKYDVLCIEDLDKLNDVKIFTKLRELNILLNNSDQINKRIVFIYAIRDDMFINTDRTKFFDFIIPIIPVVNSTNSGEILYKKITDNSMAEHISERFIKDITIYIDDMRTLKNIFNEFVIYREKLKGVTLNLEKLLAIIIYKNVLPDDFAKLQFNEGIVFNAFSNKSRLKISLQEGLQKDIDAREKKIDDIRNEQLQSEREIKHLFLSTVVNAKRGVTQIDYNGKSYSIDLFLSDDVKLEQFRNGQITLSTPNGPIHTSMDDANKKLGERNNFVERAENILLKKRVDDIKQEIAALRREKDDISHMTLVDLLRRSDTSILSTELRSSKLILFLLRNGYIDDMYTSYISYFYPGSLAKGDMDFILSVKNYESLSYDFKLTRIDTIIGRLNIKDFSQKEILNCDLLDYLISSSSCSDLLERFFEVLVDESRSSLDFIEFYINRNNNLKEFIEILSRNWENMWYYVKFVSNFTNEKVNQFLLLILNFSDINVIKKFDVDRSLSMHISSTENFFEYLKADNRDKILQILKTLKVKFVSLLFDIDYLDSFLFILKNNLYEISKKMMKTVMVNVLGIDEISYDTSNYTAIKTSSSEEMKQYIDENILVYVDNVLLKLQHNSSESEEYLRELLNNENVPLDKRNEIINISCNKISDLSAIPAEVWKHAITNNKVAASWHTLLVYYDNYKVLDETIINFVSIKSNIEQLVQSEFNESTIFSEDVISDFVIAIVKCLAWPDDIYELLVKNIPYVYSDFSLSDIPYMKAKIIVTNDFLSFTNENIAHIKNSHIDLLGLFFSINIKSYLSASDSYVLEESAIITLLNSDLLNVKQKKEIINHAKGCPSENSAKAFIKVIMQKPEMEVTSKIYNDIMKIDTDQTTKVSLFINQFQYIQSDFEAITQSLELLGKPFSDLTTTGNKVVIENSAINLKLIKELHRVSYIFLYKKGENELRIRS